VETLGFHQKYLKVSLLWIIKGSYFGFGSPQQQVDMHARSKTLSLSCNMHLFFTLFDQRLSSDLFNDSFFQTSPLHDAHPIGLFLFPFHNKSIVCEGSPALFTAVTGETAILASSGKE